MNSIKVVLAVVVVKVYVTKQLGADTAFLNSNLKEEVYMEVFNGITNAEKMMCKLDKAIYDSNKLRVHEKRLSMLCFCRLVFEAVEQISVYVKVNNGNFVYVCLYVDDMIIAAKTSREIQEVKTALKHSFKMKELGKVKLILGMEINNDRNASTLRIRQTRYIDDVVCRFNQDEVKAVVNPCESGLKLSKMQSPATDAEKE
ncbi:unnamed protein product [Peronospora farinosa]|uniref:Reverse transcriptase Ty1/copia-type domain-containing protein n=1 Tax=Peronospora farinosa TaxID=134698 RepID=A0AAV0UKX0_9STRA|nr:unnamed protein product [Peronospora farinosa]